MFLSKFGKLPYDFLQWNYILPNNGWGNPDSNIMQLHISNKEVRLQKEQDPSACLSIGWDAGRNSCTHKWHPCLEEQILCQHHVSISYERNNDDLPTNI